ncbi:hypothetical protein VTJ04DRAFT_7476 [Mycothermus thermophilus]|uniref:uncharacterized protein n=1 Tax=Humicola insolens TaxID=85995 RepID=UPI003743B790
MAPTRPSSTKRRRTDASHQNPLIKRPKWTSSVTPGLIALSRPPTQRLNIYVVGANSGGELGLGPDVKSGTIGKPRLNPYLSGVVVQVSLGAMHGVALTADNRILTWGVNDHGALGRDTTWAGNFVDVDDADSEDDDGAQLNPHECVPRPVDMSLAPAGTMFTQVAATDNATFVLTSSGFVYGWGTFRSEDGKLSFSPTVSVQSRPVLIPNLKNVTKLCCGSNHVLALTSDNLIYTWGRGTEGQLGRRFSKRVVNWIKEGLIPRPVAMLRNIIDIGSGASHSFAVHRLGHLYAWGFNNAGQTGVLHSSADKTHDPDDWDITVPVPRLVTTLPAVDARGIGIGIGIKSITGGNFHTLALTHDGRCFSWGRLYSFATGHTLSRLPPELVALDSRCKPSSLLVPRAVDSGAFQDGVVVAQVSAASEHNLAVGTDGKVYTWGLSLTKQIGQKGDEVKVPTLLAHPSVVEKRFVWVGTGAQFSMFGEAVG